MTSKKLKVEHWPIEKLIEYARNPRKNDHAVDQVAAAIKEFGFRVPLVAKSDGLLVDGHLRLKAAKKLGLNEVPVILADDLSEAQIKAFRISVNRMADLAEWDNELLALEFAELKELGFDTSLTGFTDFDIFALDNPESEKTDSEGSSSDGEVYTKKVEAPIYTPKGEKPNENELFDVTKTKELLSEIDSIEAPESVKDFLRLAAARHTVFDYGKIAEYYCHASPEIQNLMENSALVIIDFNKAIEKGFVKLTQDFQEAYDNEFSAKNAEVKIPEVLSKASLEDFDELLKFCQPYWKQNTDLAVLKKHTKEMIDSHKNGDKEIPKGNVVRKLLDKWYASLNTKNPDYSVYEDPNYLADIWTCWVAYSRKSVKVLLEKCSLIDKSLASVLDQKGTIIDAGCGIAYTTIAFKQAFPTANVVGTNFEGSWQYLMATELGKKYGFEMKPNPFAYKNVELFFASEYFEHITNPLEHLREIVSECSPKYFVIANGFNGISIGHFNHYTDKGNTYSNTDMSKMFLKEMRLLGYEKLETKIWNNRPSIWRRK